MKAKTLALIILAIVPLASIKAAQPALRKVLPTILAASGVAMSSHNQSIATHGDAVVVDAKEKERLKGSFTRAGFNVSDINGKYVYRPSGRIQLEGYYAGAWNNKMPPDKTAVFAVQKEEDKEKQDEVECFVLGNDKEIEESLNQIKDEFESSEYELKITSARTPSGLPFLVFASFTEVAAKEGFIVRLVKKEE